MFKALGSRVKVGPGEPGTWNLEPGTCRRRDGPPRPHCPRAGRDDYIEIALDTSADPPEVIGRTSHSRGSRTIAEERQVKSGAPPQTITEEEFLEFLVEALGPWLER